MSDIVKICKKHGELTLEQTYEMFRKKYNKSYLMCCICKKGYRNDWAKLNPEKVKSSQEKKRQKRLHELSEGRLTKHCKRHGDIPIEKIRVDTRGTKICRLCDVENKRALIKRNPEKFKKRVAAWLHSDPERKRRYRENDKPKRRIRQRRLYKKWMQIPEKKKRIGEQSEKSRKKSVQNLSDAYIKAQIRNYRRGRYKGPNFESQYLADIVIPNEVIELKRQIIKLSREIRKRRNKDGNK